ncbi:MAG: hypothetical protein WBO73_14125 [Gammaproteobacteria bacterium]|jgi:hypothetical protein
MISKQSTIYSLILLFVGLTGSVVAEPINQQDIADYQKQIERLDKLNFHPNLLPLILKHRDYLELTPEQLDAFRAWRKINAKPMFAAMNDIISKRIEFREAALSPDISAEDLRQKQQEIFALHQKVLDYKLSCRANIHKTFTEQNWDDFFVVLAEEGYAIPESATSMKVIGLSELDK